MARITIAETKPFCGDRTHRTCPAIAKIDAYNATRTSPAKKPHVKRRQLPRAQAAPTLSKEMPSQRTNKMVKANVPSATIKPNVKFPDDPGIFFVSGDPAANSSALLRKNSTILASERQCKGLASFGAEFTLRVPFKEVHNMIQEPSHEEFRSQLSLWASI